MEIKSGIAEQQYFMFCAEQIPLCHAGRFDRYLIIGDLMSDPSNCLIFKICPALDWQQAVERGAFRGSPIDLQDGFIHFSAAHQVQETAAKHFRGQKDLLLVAVPADRLGDALKWEASRGGDLFPHLYGALDTDLAIWDERLQCDEDGVPVIPERVTSC